VWYLSYLFCKQRSNVWIKGDPTLTVLKIVTKNVQLSGTEHLAFGLKLTGVLRVRFCLLLLLRLLFLLLMLRHRNKRKGQCSAIEPMEMDRPGRVGGANTIREEAGGKSVEEEKKKGM
jgi:hypothetical protein